VEDFTCFSIQDNSKIMMMWSNGLFINKDDSQVIKIRLWKVFGKDLLVPSSGCNNRLAIPERILSYLW